MLKELSETVLDQIQKNLPNLAAGELKKFIDGVRGTESIIPEWGIL